MEAIIGQAGSTVNTDLLTGGYRREQQFDAMATS